jgi:hypothetical protein
VGRFGAQGCRHNMQIIVLIPKYNAFQKLGSFSIIVKVGLWAGSAHKDADTTCR